MKLALFSDIHANLPALESFFTELDKREIDAVYCLGDLVGYNIWPNEVIREIRKRKIPVIFGNYDQGVGLSSDDCGCAYKTEKDKEMGKVSIAFTNSIIGEEERKYLRSLPAHFRVEFKNEKHTVSLVLVHGSPRKVNEYLFEDREDKSFLRIMEDAHADIMCFGHTHKPFHKILTAHGNSSWNKHAVNIGSVGKPKDGNPQGCFAILTIDADLDLSSPSAVKVEFVRFTYDVEKAASAVEQSILPNEFAEMLRKGI